MAASDFVVVIRFRWWFKFYLFGVAVMTCLTDQEPHKERFEYWVGRGTYFELKCLS